MKIMSFNTQHCMNYITKEIDYQVMADAILKCDADVVGLQEMRYEDPESGFTRQTEKLAELTGMEYCYFAKAVNIEADDGWFGNGLISRIPIVKVETIPIPDPEVKTGDQLYETRCILKATLENGYTVLCTHFGLNEDEHINAVRTVLENLEGEKCILMGDFNVRPENEVLLPIREAMKDTSELFSEPLVSFPSDNPNRKIDYIFVSDDVYLLDADIPAIIAADHRPHTATIKVVK